MSVLNTVTLLFNGLTLSLALGFLLIVLWNNAGKELNQFFAIFLCLVTLWNVGSFTAQAASLIDTRSPLIGFAIGLMELGFTGSSIGVYALTAVLVKAYNLRFRFLAFASLLLVLAYRLFLIATSAPMPFDTLEAGLFSYQSQPFLIVFYLVFDTITLYLVWRYHRKIRSRGLVLGIVAFVIGQTLGFLNPELQAFSVSIILSSGAALVISFSVLRQEIINPLAERVSQVEAMHKVTLAITSQIAIDTVLNQIATQAAEWLTADAAGIFLGTEDELELSAVYNLPPQYLHARLPMGQGLAGVVAQTHQSAHLDDYSQEWQGKPDLSLARETFGAVICTPLIYGGEAIGVLMVIAGRHGKLFAREDVRLLELLASQAAVAIAHSRLFAEQGELAQEVEAARSQLETVLVSTENPVIAVDRKYRLIFANPAAQTLFLAHNGFEARSIFELLPAHAFPQHYRQLLGDVRSNRAHIYEVSIDDKVFLCHLAPLGRPRIAGWVAVLNDVTQLKELDRLKSEMVRMTSHDLKNPLQAAMANLDLLNDDLADVEDPEIHQSIQIIEKQLQRMNRIISGILDLERVKSGRPTTEICSPLRIVKHTLDELGHLAKDQKILLEETIESDIPNFVGDHDQFQRALINLVENAIKFTPIGGTVSVDVYKQDSNVIFRVSDTGVGIPDDLQQKVFDRFFRGKQKGVEHISGSGLGLSLVKAVVENHRGKVWLESKVGLGTKFYVSIPASSKQEVVV
jgi:signal transduction histidine kinase